MTEIRTRSEGIPKGVDLSETLKASHADLKHESGFPEFSSVFLTPSRRLINTSLPTARSGQQRTIKLGKAGAPAWSCVRANTRPDLGGKERKGHHPS